MGNFGLYRLLRCVLLGAASLAAAFVAAVILAAPAAANQEGSGNDPSEKNWDSDNLRFGGYSSASFRIPSHSYGTATAPRYSHAACGHGGIADGFYQTRSDVNDFPVLQYTGGAHSMKAWSSSSLACDEFVRAQERMATEATTNGGHWLDKNGNLQETALPSRIASRPSSLAYSTWENKRSYPGQFAFYGTLSLRKNGNAYFYQGNNPFTSAVTQDASYQRRLDVFGTDAPSADWAIYPDGATLEVVWGDQTSPTGRYLYFNWAAANSQDSTKIRGKIAMNTGVAAVGFNRHLTAAQSANLCPAGFHSRGEDSVGRIGSTTGRTLSHLSHAEGQIADRFWCRSDLRFLRKFYPNTRPGVALHPQAQSMSATAAFYVYGRVNCFYTADRYPADTTNPDPAPGSQTTGLISLGDNAYDCEYPYHPLPLCDPDPDNGSNTDWRAYTKTEIDRHGQTGQRFRRAAGADCGASGPPSQAGFTADPCVTAGLSIYENRPSGENADCRSTYFLLRLLSRALC